MSGTTSLLSIPYPVGTDDVSGYPAISLSAATILDRAIALTQEGATTHTTATGGQIIAASAGVTVTLPDPTVGSGGSTVGVFAVSGVTGANPVTVEYGVGGGAIYGVGAAGVSSYLLGAGQATTILLSDGLNWQIISGQQDTGWVELTSPAGSVTLTSVGDYHTASARLQGDRILLRGAMECTSGSISEGTNWARLPLAVMYPNIQATGINVGMPLAAADSFAYPICFTVDNNGHLFCAGGISTPAITSGDGPIVLDGCSFSLT